MPHRLVCVLILVIWSIAAGALFTRDVLPNLLIGPPPDLRSISQSETADEGPVRWSILASDDDKKSNLRSVGQVTTETVRKRDGWVRLASQAWIDAAEVLGIAPSGATGERVLVSGNAEIDTTGNLQSFRVGIKLDDGGKVELLNLEGHVKKGVLEVATHSQIPLLGSMTTSIPYKPRGIVQNSLGPLDRMPGLQVGQTWETQVVSPLTGKVQTGRVEVVGNEYVVWGNTPVNTLKVVTKVAAISAATWVRTDGLVLRQELPFPHRTKLLLERIPEDPANANSPPSRNRRDRR